MSDRSLRPAWRTGTANAGEPRAQPGERELLALQVELVRMQRWARDTGARVALIEAATPPEREAPSNAHRAPELPGSRVTSRSQAPHRHPHDRPVVLPAVRRRSASDSWRGRLLRPLLVTTGPGVERVMGASPPPKQVGLASSDQVGAVRGVPRERRHPLYQDLARKWGKRSSGGGWKQATGGPVAAVEAQPDGRGRTRQAGRLHAVDGRDVHAHRRAAVSVVVVRQQQPQARRAHQRGAVFVLDQIPYEDKDATGLAAARPRDRQDLVRA